jgi:hypothetical protein
LLNRYGKVVHAVIFNFSSFASSIVRFLLERFGKAIQLIIVHRLFVLYFLLLNRYGKVVHIVIFNFFRRARRLFVPFLLLDRHNKLSSSLIIARLLFVSPF